MDYAEFGTVVATIAATGAAEHTGGKIVDSVSDGVTNLRSKLRSWFTKNDDTGGLVQTLETVEHSPTPLSIEMLATALKIAASNDPDGAEKIAELAQKLDPEAFGSSVVFTTTIRDNAKVDKIMQAGGDITIYD